MKLHIALFLCVSMPIAWIIKRLKYAIKEADLAGLIMAMTYVEVKNYVTMKFQPL